MFFFLFVIFFCIQVHKLTEVNKTSSVKLIKLKTNNKYDKIIDKVKKANVISTPHNLPRFVQKII